MSKSKKVHDIYEIITDNVDDTKSILHLINSSTILPTNIVKKKSNLRFWQLDDGGLEIQVITSQIETNTIVLRSFTQDFIIPMNHQCFLF